MTYCIHNKRNQLAPDLEKPWCRLWTQALKSLPWLWSAIFLDSDESLAILSGRSWFSIPSTAERGWRYLNHLENAPSVTSELLVEKHEANLSPNICLVVRSSHILVGTVGFVWHEALTFLFLWHFINIFPTQQHVGLGSSEEEGSES